MLALYTVDDKYIAYLHNTDNKVLLEHDRNRPYVGIVLQINNCSYFAPLASYKPKHDKISNKSLDAFKVVTKTKKYSVINLNNMIPVADQHIKEIEIKNLERKYANMVQNETYIIRKHEKVIIKKATNLYKEINKQHSASKNLKDRCCNFKLLEEKMLEYNQIKTTNKQKIISKITINQPQNNNLER